MFFFLKVSVSLTLECKRSTKLHRDKAILNTCNFSLSVCFSCDVFLKGIIHGGKNIKGVLISLFFLCCLSIVYVSTYEY